MSDIDRITQSLAYGSGFTRMLNDEISLLNEELVKSNSIVRKVSCKKTDECPIYDPDMDQWVESDEDLKNRRKSGLLETK